LRLKKDYFNDVQSQVKSSLILILDRSGSMEGSRLDIARELAIRVARAFFSTQNPAITSQNEEALVIIFDDKVIHQSFRRFVDLENFLNDKKIFFANGGTTFTPSL
jgi:uncharacterized protein with von Willebrand factor type A (vWA) domain